ncbi:MipA/OmpV family protein [Thalassomonas viridans]|uniref:MipA/OmpV family protein n=1 Tax=Thalassomonas viridans TaxID=137584 RepID=A0AAE9ZC76_9GAMM|nr:MipA/OmpV family protein [Thalassomonas viridans]WDE08558.1 MipA/OmpV family protein [Thalassomonas viridans]
MKLITYAVLLAAVTSGNVFAESRWGLGLGASTGDKGYVDVGNETNAIPIIYFESENFQLLGPNFGYKLLSFDDLEFSFVGQYRFDGYEEDDGDIFAGMEERSGALDLGLAVDYATEFGDFSLQFVTDATSEHEGNELSLTYAKSYNFGSYQLKPYVTFSRLSEDLVDHYYGVRATEATASRAMYLGESTSNVELGIQSSWQVGKHHNFIGYASYTAYGSEIKDSPLIDKSGNLNFILGYMYVF